MTKPVVEGETHWLVVKSSLTTGECWIVSRHRKMVAAQKETWKNNDKRKRWVNPDSAYFYFTRSDDKTQNFEKWWITA